MTVSYELLGVLAVLLTPL